MPWTYMLRCGDGSYYVGSTWQLEKRVDQHQKGFGAEYTKRRLPVELVYAAEFDRIDEAFSWEKRLQGWGRAKREALLRGEFALLPGLSRRRGGRPRGQRAEEAGEGEAARGLNGLEARSARTSTNGEKDLPK